jgi:hypothetical protein
MWCFLYGPWELIKYIRISQKQCNNYAEYSTHHYTPLVQNLVAQATRPLVFVHPWLH